MLRMRERDSRTRKLLSREYSDTILVFDYDPQDHLFSVEKLERMVDYFDESTDQGKLYVNYPMAESYRDLTTLPYDDSYLDRSVDLDTLRNKAYKKTVDLRSAVPQLDECNVLTFNQILVQNIEKASKVTGNEYVASDPLRNYATLSQSLILEAQANLLTEYDIVSVLCTCLWFVIDYGPQQLARFLVSHASWR